MRSERRAADPDDGCRRPHPAGADRVASAAAPVTPALVTLGPDVSGECRTGRTGGVRTGDLAARGQLEEGCTRVG